MYDVCSTWPYTDLSFVCACVRCVHRLYARCCVSPVRVCVCAVCGWCLAAGRQAVPRASQCACRSQLCMNAYGIPKRHNHKHRVDSYVS